jgi:hypothetical protein
VAWIDGESGNVDRELERLLEYSPWMTFPEAMARVTTEEFLADLARVVTYFRDYPEACAEMDRLAEADRLAVAGGF